MPIPLLDFRRTLAYPSTGLKNKQASMRIQTLLLPLSVYAVLCIPTVSAEETVWQGYERLGDEAKKGSDWAQVEEAYTKAVDAMEKAACCKRDNEKAALLNKLGEVHFRRKDFYNAEMAYRQAL